MIHLPPRSTLYPYATHFLSRPTTAHERGSTGPRLRTTAALPYQPTRAGGRGAGQTTSAVALVPLCLATRGPLADRSEEHTSEFQLRQYLVCRILLAKNKRSH